MTDFVLFLYCFCTVFVLKLMSLQASDAGAEVEMDPRGGRAPSECVVVMHGRVRCDFKGGNPDFKRRIRISREESGFPIQES